MTLQQLIQLALNKQHFTTTDDYAIFADITLHSFMMVCKR